MAGAFDLYSGNRSISGSNNFKVDKNPLDNFLQGVGKDDRNTGGPPAPAPLFPTPKHAVSIITVEGDPEPDVTGLPDGAIWFEVKA